MALTATAKGQGVGRDDASEEDKGSPLPNLLLADLQERIRTAEPDPERVPADLTPVLATNKYVFRTSSAPGGGGRNFSYRIPVDRGYSVASSDRTREQMEARYKRKTSEAQRKKYDDLVERVGGVWIQFTPVHKRFESYFATNDKVVATYIRGEIKSGAMSGVYEDPGTITIACEACLRLNPDGEPARFASSERGRRELLLHMRSAHPGFGEE